ncbi:MAG: hypothetical protein IJQ74_04140, partial [Synergistaceae bacterium]|nr:hypothetical protein [Synergistaceae bacterium]
MKIENYEINPVTNDYINGYWAKVKVSPKELGQAKVYYKLITEYTYMNHEPKEDIREGTFFIDVVEKVPEGEGNWDGNRSLSTTPVSTERPTGGSSTS